MLSAAELNRRFIEQMQQPNLIRNVHTDIQVYHHNGILIPTSVNAEQPYPDNGWVVSPLTQLIGYSRDEIPKLNSKLLRVFNRFLIATLAAPLRWAQLDRIQIFNNYCLSTNLYADEWRDIDLAVLRQQAQPRYPRHALMLRSVNEIQNKDLMARAHADHWLPLVNRQVYLYRDKAQWWARHNSRIDDRLLSQSGWSFRLLDPHDEAEMARAEQLYNQLYLDKYSRHNVQFSADCLSRFSRSGLIELYGLFQHQQLLGVAGLFGLEQTLTAPIIGYDTQQPVQLALYRRLIAFVIRQAMERGLRLNLSAGSSDFKRRRGGEAVIEYSLVYVRHLSVYQRTVWRLLSWLSQTFYRPMLERFKL